MNNKKEIFVCTGKECAGKQSKQIIDILKKEYTTDTDISACGCLGNCERGVNAVVDGEKYERLTPGNVVTALQSKQHRVPKNTIEEIDIDELFTDL